MGAVVLLSEDERWREKKGEKAYYIHNLVTSVSAAEQGKQLLREVETMAVSEGKNIFGWIVRWTIRY